MDNPASIGLDNSKTFENFSVSVATAPKAAFAFEVSKLFIGKYSASENPLLLVGIGTEKRHLLHAIGNRAVKQGITPVRDMKADYFWRECAEAKDARGSLSLRNYSGLALFLMEDVHLVAGHPRAEERLFCIFNELFDRRIRMAFTSEYLPDEISSIYERLASRLEWGRIVEI